MNTGRNALYANRDKAGQAGQSNRLKYLAPERSAFLFGMNRKENEVQNVKE